MLVVPELTGSLESDVSVLVSLEAGSDSFEAAPSFEVATLRIGILCGPGHRRVPAAVPSVVAALAAKYTSPQDQQYLPSHDPGFDVVYAVRPRSAMAWRLDDYAASQRRWTTGRR